MLIEQQKTASAPEEQSALLRSLGADKIASPMSLGILVADQVMDYRRPELRKIAMDVKHGVGGADKAFRFVYYKIRGWDVPRSDQNGLPTH